MQDLIGCWRAGNIPGEGSGSKIIENSSMVIRIAME